MASSPGLTRIPLPALRLLLAEVEQGRMSPPFTGAALLATGLAHLAEEIGGLRSFDEEGLVKLLEAVILERERAEAVRFDLVWTGPEARLSPSRDTSVVVRELFCEARSDVLIGGYAFSEGGEIFQPLHDVMVSRGVETAIFLDVEGSWEKGVLRTTEQTREQIESGIAEFFAKNWPFGEPRPAIYCAPATAEAFSKVSLHAKCLVVDRSRALVTSANFTDRGQTRNIEVGVLISDRGFARRLHAQWWGLVSAGLVRRYEP